MAQTIKKSLVITATLFAILAILTCHPVSFAHAQNEPLRVYGLGVINECIIDLIFDQQIGTGRLIYLDKTSNNMVFGEITSATLESGSTMNISGSYTTEDNVSHTFRASVEDLGKPGKGIDKFSITLSDGYTKSGILDQGEIEISY